MYDSWSAPSPTVKSSAAGCMGELSVIVYVAAILSSTQYTTLPGLADVFQSIRNLCDPVNILPAMVVSIGVPLDPTDRANSVPATFVPNIANGPTGGLANALGVPNPAYWPAAPLNVAVNSIDRPGP